MSLTMLLPKNDYVFKMMMGEEKNVDLLVDFLHEVLGIPIVEIRDLTVNDPHLRGDSPESREFVLDVRVRTSAGRDINIEIQLRPFSKLPERILLYGARLLDRQAGSGKEGYKRIGQAICILLVEHVLWNDDLYHHRFRLYDPDADLELTDALEIHTLEMTKRLDDSRLGRWVGFIGAGTEEELMIMAEKDPVIAKARAVLVELSADERTRLLAESREKFVRDQEQREFDAEEKGLKRGRAEGLEKGRMAGIIQTAENALSHGVSVAEVANFTGLPLEEVRRMAAGRGKRG